jgi:hypothetical protein
MDAPVSGFSAKAVFTGGRNCNPIRYDLHSFHNAPAACIFFLRSSLQNGRAIKNIMIVFSW